MSSASPCSYHITNHGALSDLVREYTDNLSGQKFKKFRSEAAAVRRFKEELAAGRVIRKVSEVPDIGDTYVLLSNQIRIICPYSDQSF